MCAIEATPLIQTDRLILRRPVISDAGELCQLANDLGVAGMLSTMPYPYTPKHADEFLGRETHWREPNFAIEHREFGFMGMIGVSEKEPGRPEIGYWLGRPFWGRGYATEALRGALGWMTSDWRRKVVWAGHFSDNKASGQVLVKAGFLYTGDVVLQDCLARGQQVPTRKMVWLA
ncbi:GNAT family N-acetyltransferase [Phenylobacterium sp. J426]|uniref:GNAT family N-acetyltransferase n=1 Tax=Phenylobacterium sp. J426 TaxID=2898439 RepID=UPI002151E9D6|nr:GNAT family N-acetyltransferase [Phenylobacterium sp. J426]MCR5873582.1 GNAT family N-acetyltransferase [Phenylobacterium sp. J426]